MILAIMVAGAIVFQALGQTPGQTQPSGSISGRVTNSVTGAGIGDALVSVWTAAQREVTQQAVTDDVGAFRISGIPDGQYMIEPSKDGFFEEIWGPTPSVRVSGETRFDLKMTPGASVRGRVLDPEDAPAAGIAVKISPLYDASITDEKGEFVFKEMPPDSYKLSATPNPQAAEKDGERVMTTYYPSVVDSGQAVPIQVHGVDLFGCDIRLQTASARKVRGVVIDIDGKPAPHATVSVSRPALGIVTIVTMDRGLVINWPESTGAAESVETKEDGTFVFPSVLEGNWRVRAVLRPDGGRRGVAEVRVSKSDVEDLELRLEEPFKLEVIPDWGDTPPPKTPQTPGMVVPLEGEHGGSWNEAGFTGRFFVGLGAMTPGHYLAAAMLGNRDVLGQVVELSGPTSLKMIYKSGGGSVRGTVENGAGAMVALMADETPALRFGYGAHSDANGGFVIPDIPPGDYSVVAFPDPRLLVGPEFPTLLAASGKRVKVEAGSAVQVDLRVARQQ